MGYYSAMERNEIWSFVEMWLELDSAPLFASSLFVDGLWSGKLSDLPSPVSKAPKRPSVLFDLRAQPHCHCYQQHPDLSHLFLTDFSSWFIAILVLF